MIPYISRFLSSILSPLLSPSYGAFLALWVSILCYQPIGTRLAVLIVIFGVTCVLPMAVIGILHNLKLIKDRNLDNRKERPLPYIATITCYIAATLYLIHVHAPAWFTAFMGGSILTCTISLIINFWWKISAHCAGFGGLVALLFFLHNEGLESFNLFWVICLVIILSGIVGSSRIYEGKHNFWQVLIGFLNGYISVNLIMNLFS